MRPKERFFFMQRKSADPGAEGDLALQARVCLYWDRAQGRMLPESVQGARFLKWSHETRMGRLLLQHLFATRLFAKIIYGWLLDTRWSGTKVQAYIDKNVKNLEMNDFEKASYPSFNAFFIRKFKPGARSFVTDPHFIPAFAEGKYLGYSASSVDQRLSIKNMILTPSEILGSYQSGPEGPAHYATLFENGPVLICRLRPTDYHRFHYPDHGKLLARYRIHGSLYATNPVSYHYNKKVFILNERQVNILDTQHFGKMAYVEVGAMCVGRIIQTHDESSSFVKGQEKGYFLVGGSTIILFGEKDRWVPAPDIEERTRQNIETQVRLGDWLGYAAACAIPPEASNL